MTIQLPATRPLSRRPSPRPLPAIASRLARTGRGIRGQAIFFGELSVFVYEAVVAIPYVLRHHRREVWTLIAEVTFGGGMLAVAASTVFVAALLSAVIGIQLGIEGLQGLNIIGLAPLAGLLSAFGNTRELTPLITGFGLAAQMGCKFTAQLGAMRVSEEIDALEVMAVPPLPYLITTRVIAALTTVIPMYLLALSGAYLASQLAVVATAHQGSGTYLHYFYLFLDRRDIVFSVVKVIVFCTLITFIHTFYGFTVTGGPEGVGRAAGRAIRASIVCIAVSDMLMTLLFWGVSSPIKVSG